MGSVLEDLDDSTPAPSAPAKGQSALETLGDNQSDTTQSPPDKPGFFGTLGSDLKGMVSGIGAGNGSTGPDFSGRVGASTKLNEKQKAQQIVDDTARKGAGYSSTYTALAPVAEGLGVNVKGMEQSAQQGDAAGVAGHAAALPVAMAATEGLARGVPFVGKSAVKGVKSITGVPAALSADTSSALAAVSHKEDLPPITSTTAREAADELSDNFVNRAKSQYQVVDKAVGGDLKPVQEKITSLKKAIRTQANVNPDLADKYIDDLAAQQKTLGELVQKAKAAGVSNAEQLMSAGDKDYARGMAMKDVAKGVKTASGIAKSGGHPNPTLLANQLDRLYNRGVLTKALGEDGAQAMLDTAKAGLAKAKTAATVKKIGVAAGAGAAATVGGTVAYHAAKGVLGGGIQGTGQ